MPDPHPETSPSYRAKRADAARARKREKALRRDAMLEAVVSGMDYGQIAQDAGISLKTLRREIDRALDERPLDAPERYVRVQVQRLTKAMCVIGEAVDKGNLKAVKPLMEVLEKLDRYHGMAARAAAEADAYAPRIASPAPLALTHEPAARTETCA
jgi:hypothetical protein